MPRPMVETTPTGCARGIALRAERLTENIDRDVRSTGSQLAIPDLDDRREQDECGHDPDRDDQPDDEGEGGVDGREHQRGHRPADGGRDQSPQGRTETLSILDSGADTAPPLCITLVG